jgi:hypothetical protein
LAVESVLLGVAGPFDISPQSFTLDAYNVASNIDITGLTFPVANVRAANIRYTVHRATDTAEIDESGMLFIVYNNLNGGWDQSQEKSGDANISFSVSSTGQVSFTTTSLAGANHVGFITYAAQSLLNP